MKNVWQRKKKIIIGAMAIVLAFTIVITNVLVNESEAEAVNILNSMKTQLKGRDEFKVLEIVPETDDANYQEMGMFVTRGSESSDPSTASLSKYFERNFRSGLAGNLRLDQLLEMRMYGLVKRAGVDTGANDEVSENPIYSVWNSTLPTFAEVTKPNSYGEVDMRYLFTPGKYVAKEGGNYKILDGYYLGDDGYIYKTPDATMTSAGTVPASEEDTDEENTDDEEEESVSENSFTPTVAEGGTLNSSVEEVIINEENLEEPTGEEPTEDEPEATSEGENSGITIPSGGYGYQSLPVSANSIKIEPDWSAEYYKKGASEDSAYIPLPEGISWVGDGSGNVSFEADANGFYWGYSSTPTYYVTDGNVKYHNANWFKALLFGDKNSAIKLTVDTVSAKDVTAEQIMNANLVYISGTAQAFAKYDSDISVENATALYNATVVSNKGVIMDYDVYSGGMNNNIDKLAILLWQQDQTKVTEKDAIKFNGNKEDKSNFGTMVDGTGVFSDSGLLTDLQSSIMTGVEGNFVTGNLYVYDHHMDLFESTTTIVDANDFFANGDFNSRYKSDVYNKAFANVYAHIVNNNTNYADSRVTDGVTPALIVQYIVSADGAASNLVKTTISVLEIQPCANFLYNATNAESTEYAYADANIKTNRDAFIKNYINPDYVGSEGKQGYVSFTSMTIEEFICKNESVIENYDMVYIGSQYSGYYYTTSTSYASDPLTGETVNKNTRMPCFNDRAMDGMVYFNIGDLFYGNASDGSKPAATGYLTNEPDNGGVYTRFAARDLTSDKLKELEAYLDAGHPIIVAKDLMSSKLITSSQDSDKVGSIKVINPTAYQGDKKDVRMDHGRIDNASKMYELFQYAMGNTFDQTTGTYVGRTISGNMVSSAYRNFISEADVDRGLVKLNDISEFLNAPQLFIDISDKPEDYEYSLLTGENANVIDPDSIKYLEQDEDGSYYLDYEFTVSGISAMDIQYVYTARLFVDVNADGKFATDEECNDAVITYASTGIEVERVVNAAGESVYALDEGTSYHLRRAIPENYSGVITWCLRAETTSDSRIQANETGFTCVKAAQKAVIRILQITKNNGTTLNLETQLKDDDGGKYVFWKYLNNLADYEVHVDTITMKQFEDNYATYTGTDSMGYFDSYKVDPTNEKVGAGVDMLILGFADYYDSFSKQESVDAVKSFMDSGRAVLLCHDFLSYHYTYLQTMSLRNIVGMDRYGVTTELKKADGKTSKYAKSLKKGPGNLMYTRSADKEEVLAVENNSDGKRVAYQPGSGRNTLLRATQGFSNTDIVRFPYQFDKYQTYSYREGAKSFNNASFGKSYAVNIHVDQMNYGQLTEYPYNIPNSFRTTSTHAQYFQLDMESDADKDGSADTVVWYTLSYLNTRTEAKDTELYAATPGDGTNQYYIYNKGNITYTGAGHASGYTEEEAQLFVNTMLASYTAVDHSPTVKFYETALSSSNEVTNVPIPYDSTIESNSKDGIGSSIVFNDTLNEYEYRFVDPNTNKAVAEKDKTPIYFKATDTNFKKGAKRISLKFYLEVDASFEVGKEITVDPYTHKTAKVEKKTIDGVERKVVQIPITVYSSDLKTPIVNSQEINEVKGTDGKVTTPGVKTEIQSGMMYGIYLPLSYLKDQGVISLYLEAQTYVSNKATSGAQTEQVVQALGYGSLNVTKVDLLKLD